MLLTPPRKRIRRLKIADADRQFKSRAQNSTCTKRRQLTAPNVDHNFNQIGNSDSVERERTRPAAGLLEIGFEGNSFTRGDKRGEVRGVRSRYVVSLGESRKFRGAARICATARSVFRRAVFHRAAPGGLRKSDDAC